LAHDTRDGIQMILYFTLSNVSWLWWGWGNNLHIILNVVCICKGPHIWCLIGLALKHFIQEGEGTNVGVGKSPWPHENI